MEIFSFLAQYGSWSWIVGGLILLAIELIVPGGIFIWLGSAAVATGLLDFILPMSWAVQWVVFGSLSLVAIILWLKFGRKAMNSKTDTPFLNRRAERFIGREVVLDEAIEQGFGKVKLDDTMWRVSGVDMKKGTMVKIVNAKSAVLEVEKVI